MVKEKFGFLFCHQFFELFFSGIGAVAGSFHWPTPLGCIILPNPKTNLTTKTKQWRALSVYVFGVCLCETVEILSC